MSKRPDYGTATPEDLACALMRPRNRRSGTSRVTDSGARPGRESNSLTAGCEPAAHATRERGLPPVYKPSRSMT